MKTCRRGHTYNGSRCTECNRLHQKKHRETNREEFNNYYKERYRKEKDENPMFHAAKAARKRAKAKGVKGVSSKEAREHWERCHGCCEYCGIALEPSKGRASDLSPSFDRIDSRLGYEFQNVAIACWGCNRAKQDSSLQKLIELVENMKRLANERGLSLED